MKRIYLFLGSEERLQAILEDFYQRMANDLLIGFFFTGKNTQEIARQQKSLLLQAMGISSEYKGKIPSHAHTNLPPILKGHFDRRLVILKETLADHGLSDSDIEIWIQFENAFRSVIVQD